MTDLEAQRASAYAKLFSDLKDLRDPTKGHPDEQGQIARDFEAINAADDRLRNAERFREAALPKTLDADRSSSSFDSADMRGRLANLRDFDDQIRPLAHDQTMTNLEAQRASAYAKLFSDLKDLRDPAKGHPDEQSQIARDFEAINVAEDRVRSAERFREAALSRTLEAKGSSGSFDSADMRRRLANLRQFDEHISSDEDVLSSLDEKLAHLPPLEDVAAIRAQIDWLEKDIQATRETFRWTDPSIHYHDRHLQH